MEKINILWADDEIDLLKPHILFLNSKGYEIITALSGDEAIDIVKENNTLSAVLLDENMPGISGLEALTKIKQLKSDLPVIMITKSEEEYIMEDAIGSKIADYLIKALASDSVNPSASSFAIPLALASAVASSAAIRSASAIANAAASASRCEISSAVSGRSTTSPVVQLTSTAVNVSDIVFSFPYEFLMPYR